PRDAVPRYPGLRFPRRRRRSAVILGTMVREAGTRVSRGCTMLSAFRKRRLMVAVTNAPGANVAATSHVTAVTVPREDPRCNRIKEIAAAPIPHTAATPASHSANVRRTAGTFEAMPG